MARLVRQLERLENRTLLAADLVVEHAPLSRQEGGEDVERLIRVFNTGEEETQAFVTSTLTSEIQNPTWTRRQGIGKYLRDPDILAHGRSADFVIAETSGFGGLVELGDINGDGASDFLIHRRTLGREPGGTYLLLGGVDAANTSFSQVTIKLRPAATKNAGRFTDYSPAGDVNGDGFDDLLFKSQIVWGHAEIGQLERSSIRNAPDLLRISGASVVRAIGDVNGDGLADMVATASPDNAFLVWGSEDFPARGVASLEQLAEESQAIALIGEVFSAGPIGDLNNDGIDDFAVTRLEPTATRQFIVASVLFGGNALLGSGPIDLNRLDGANGFHVSNLIKADVPLFDPFAVEPQSAGDVNGDGIGDLLIGFDGSVCGPGCNDLDLRYSNAGAILILGGANVGQSGIVDEPSEHVITYQLQAPYGKILFPKHVDANADGLSDLHFVASNRNYVVFGGEQVHNRDFGHSDEVYEGFNGSDGFLLDGVVNYADIDADGIEDLLISGSDPLPGQQPGQIGVYLGAARFPETEALTGSGDLSDVLSVPAGASVVYRVTGRLRTDGPEMITAVSPAHPDLAEDLLDNVAGAAPRPFLDVDLRSVGGTIPGQPATIELRLTNAGPVAANVHITEDISAAFESGEWSRQTQVLPASVPLERASQFHGFSVSGSGQFGKPHSDAPSRIGTVGVLGDVNGDGFQDLVVGSRIAFGGPDFGNTASLGSGRGQIVLRSSESFAGIYGVGKVNDDETDDFVVTPPFRGCCSLLVYGQTDWTIGDKVAEMSLGELDSVELHSTVEAIRAAGDLNGDGQSDLLVKARGRYHIIPSSTESVSRLQDDLGAENGVIVSVGTSEFTDPIALLGDVNADGRDDFVITMIETGWPHARSYLVFGGDSVELLGDQITGRMSWEELTQLDGFPIPGSIFHSGDVNGDGINDVVANGYVLFGNATLSDLDGLALADLDGHRGFQWIEAPSGSGDDRRYLSDVIDFNGDGFDDLITAHAFECLSCKEAPMFVYFGGPSMGSSGVETLRTDGLSGFKLDNGATDFVFNPSSQNYDMSLASGDLNADGADDIFITDLSEGPGPYTGSLFVFLGHPSPGENGLGSIDSAVELLAGNGSRIRFGAY